jgi:hypothetical protein
MSEQPVTLEEFTRRLAALCVKSGILGLPTRRRDRDILLSALVMSFGGRDTMPGSAVDEALRFWLETVAPKLDTDHVALRRALVDWGYAERTSDGRDYRILPLPGGTPLAFDPAAVDVVGLLAEERRKEAERREAFQAGR